MTEKKQKKTREEIKKPVVINKRPTASSIRPSQRKMETKDKLQ